MRRFSARPVFVVIGVAFAAIALIAGCANNPYEFADPPTVAVTDNVRRPDAPRRIIVVGEFANPQSSSLPWNDIGKGMSDALARTLFNEGRYDVWLRPELSRQVESVLRISPSKREAELAKIQKANPDVDYVLTGRVTDFFHVRDLSKGFSESGLFSSKPEAFVAMQLDMVDLPTRRVIAIGHVFGTARADESRTVEAYKGLRFSAYLFWSTPLGKASNQAIRRTMEHLYAFLPSQTQTLRIAQATEDRRVTILGGSDHGVVNGERFYVLRIAPGGLLDPVLDPDTRTPLQVRIDSVSKDSSTAWLMGKRPRDVDLRGAALDRQLPSGEPSAGLTRAGGPG